MPDILDEIDLIADEQWRKPIGSEYMPEQTFNEAVEELQYHVGQLLFAIMDEVRGSINLVVRCLLKVCDWF